HKDVHSQISILQLLGLSIEVNYAN
ncbi:uncharacterized protein METZ01_LOCUS503743, partial [marine metagenome]